MLRASVVASLVLLAGCDSAEEVETMPVVQIVGADLRFHVPGSGPTLNVWPGTREVGRVPAPTCDDPFADCIPGEVTNAVLPEKTRLVADQDVRIRGATVRAGDDLLPALGDLARVRLAVYPFSVAALPIGPVSLSGGPVRMTASWETDDGLTFSSSAVVRR